MKSVLSSFFVAILVTFSSNNLIHAQSVAINTSGAVANTSSILDVSSTTAGVLVPRMTSAQRTAIATPATGLYVYDTTTGSFWYFDGTVWREMLTNTTGWTLTGNSIAAANLIGTTNAQAFRFYCNNIERMRINPTDGEIVAGATGSPYAGDLFAGVATATLTFGVNGYCSVAGGAGTWGEIMAASNTNFSGVQGVYGGSGAGAGVLGNYAGTNTGALRAGVVGVLTAPVAAATGVGVYGANQIASGNQRIGVYGTYNGAAYGLALVGVAFGGTYPAGNNDIAVVGWRANNQNYSGYFNGNHTIVNGTKSASVGTEWGNQLLYCTESPEVWFEDIGRGTLNNGMATIELDSIFKQVTFIDAEHPIHVFIQLEGECEEVFVTPGTTSFTVKEKNNGQSNTNFSYRVMAKRVNFQDHRYGNDPVWGAGDTRPYGQYAYPPPVDYYENVKFQEEQKKNWKPTPFPEGFFNYFNLQEDLKEKSEFFVKPFAANKEDK